MRRIPTAVKSFSIERDKSQPGLGLTLSRSLNTRIGLLHSSSSDGLHLVGDPAGKRQTSHHDSQTHERAEDTSEY